METDNIIIVSVFGAAWAALMVVCVVLFTQVAALRRRIAEMQATGRIRVQKLRMNNDKNHAFHNPGLVADEELSKRGFSMYAPDDVESARAPERQTGGLADDLAREIQNRQQRQSTFLQDVETRQKQPEQDYELRQPTRQASQQDSDNRQSRQSYHQEIDNRQKTFQQEIENRQLRQSTAPPFLLQSIEANKKKRTHGNPMANGRQSDTNPNFIY